jgi:methylenetetrahydrofolate dehydrogenase (NADP+)/methenyltetrahydrofolate cyclohydrolase
MSAQLLKGAPVAAALGEKTSAKCAALREKGVVPTLAIVRAGERADDLAYERGAKKRCEACGIEVKTLAFPENVSQERLCRALTSLNADIAIHGILLMRPLPRGLDEQALLGCIAPEKDVDCATQLALGSVCTGSGGPGFAPCTAQAVIEMLHFYLGENGISGKRAAVIGRSRVVGLPAAMLLQQRDATVTLCHSKTQDLAAVCRGCSIVVAACGRTESLGPELFAPGQTVIDVGIGWSEEKQKLCGDVKTDEVSGIVSAITPVPGGVGAVTTAVLALHIAEAAERLLEAAER